MANHCFVVLGLALGAVFICGRADGEDLPAIKEVTIADAQKAVFHMTDGTSAGGKLMKLDGKIVNCVVNGKKYNYSATRFKAVELQDGMLIYLPARNAFVRLEPVKVTNNSGEKVTFRLNAAVNHVGTEVVLADDRAKSNLATGLTAFTEAFGGLAGAPPKEAPVVEWTLEPGKSAELKYGAYPIRSNCVWFTLKNEHGSTKQKRENAKIGEEFVVAVEKADVHTPVLVKFGDWKLDQDVTYTVVRGREPARAVTVPVESFDKKKVRYETTYYEGRDYEYTRRENAGIATATAEVENPTDKPLKVAVTLEFSFEHLLLSQTQVTSQIEVAAKSKGLVRMEVNTKGFVNNRNVTGVKVLDVTTTPK